MSDRWAWSTQRSGQPLGMPWLAFPTIVDCSWVHFISFAIYLLDNYSATPIRNPLAIYIYICQYLKYICKCQKPPWVLSTSEVLSIGSRKFSKKIEVLSIRPRLYTSPHVGSGEVSRDFHLFMVETFAWVPEIFGDDIWYLFPTNPSNLIPSNGKPTMNEGVSLQPCQFFSLTSLALEGSLTHGRCSAKPIRPSANNLPSLPGRSFKMKRRSCGESEDVDSVRGASLEWFWLLEWYRQNWYS